MERLKHYWETFEEAVKSGWGLGCLFSGLASLLSVFADENSWLPQLEVEEWTMPLLLIAAALLFVGLLEAGHKAKKKAKEAESKAQTRSLLDIPLTTLDQAQVRLKALANPKAAKAADWPERVDDARALARSALRNHERQARAFDAIAEVAKQRDDGSGQQARLAVLGQAQWLQDLMKSIFDLSTKID